MSQEPDAARLRAVQNELDRLSERVEQEPQHVLDAIPALLDELQTWPQRDAYLWCLHLAGQAFRFTDQLDAAVGTAELALEVAAPDSGFAAGLHLEAGMALNQKGESAAAELHLAAAVAAYRALEDQAGLAWALVAEADALCGLARQEEALHLVTEAEAAGRSGGDERAVMRALKQRAVVQRQHGDLADALGAIEAVITGTTGHARANALLERGHILAMSQQYGAATDDYVAANVEYATYGDELGLANTERALANIDLLLGRERAGLEHLTAAADLYRELGNHSGLGYALRERSVVLLSTGDPDAAYVDATEAVQLFERSGDLLGLSGAWRSVARVADVIGRPDQVATTLAEATKVAHQTNNPLAVAGVQLMRAEIGDVSERALAAVQALNLYDRLDIPTGSAHAAAFAARAARDTSPTDALGHLETAATRLRRARRRVVDPGRRADHDMALRSVTAEIVGVGVAVGSQTGTELAAEAIVESFPLALRRPTNELLTAHVRELAQRATRLRTAGDDAALRAALRRLAVAVTTLPDRVDDEQCHLTIADLRQLAPDAALLVVGAPTPTAHVPIACSLPGCAVTVSLPELNADAVDAIDELGRLVDGRTPDVLWRPDATQWRDGLAGTLLPADLRGWLVERPPADLLLVVHPTLAHVPFEAFNVSPDVPLGVIAAVRRLLLPASTEKHGRCEQIVAFFDPALDWSAEQEAVGAGLASATEWLSRLGANTLAVFAAHGDASVGFEAWLRTADGRDAITAADMLTASLSGAVVVFEACWAGRHLGHRTGETLNMTTAALMAGAAGVISGLWALPADPESTGRLVALCLDEIRNGTQPAEALRLARRRFLDESESPVRVPGTVGEHMTRSAPWAWAGLCAYC